MPELPSVSPQVFYEALKAAVFVAMAYGWVSKKMSHAARDRLEADEKARSERSDELAALRKELRKDAEAMREGLEAQVEACRASAENMRASLEKDIGHVKEAQQAELKNLSEKIELLRNEVREQHSNQMILLTKLIEGDR